MCGERGPLGNSTCRQVSRGKACSLARQYRASASQGNRLNVSSRGREKREPPNWQADRQAGQAGKQASKQAGRKHAYNSYKSLNRCLGLSLLRIQ